MAYGEVGTRQFWLGEALVNLKGLVQLLGEGFMCRLWEHAGSEHENEVKYDNKEIDCYN